MLRKPITWVVIAVVLAGAGFGLYWFAPWKLVTSTTVHETLSSPAPVAPAPVAPSTGGAASTTPAGPVVLAKGAFVTHEHSTSGDARIVRLPDGTRRLEIANLSTSDGPDLRIWLTDQPVKSGSAGWTVFDDGRYLELGRLKGNKGDQAYDIPAGTDLAGYRSVSIWCKRFSVSFGAAELDPPPGG
jgi:hypothetical protein